MTQLSASGGLSTGASVSRFLVTCRVWSAVVQRESPLTSVRIIPASLPRHAAALGDLTPNHTLPSGAVLDLTPQVRRPPTLRTQCPQLLDSGAQGAHFWVFGDARVFCRMNEQECVPNQHPERAQWENKPRKACWMSWSWRQGQGSQTGESEREAILEVVRDHAETGLGRANWGGRALCRPKLGVDLGSQARPGHREAECHPWALRQTGAGPLATESEAHMELGVDRHPAWKP